MRFQDYFIQVNLVYIIGCLIFILLLGTPIVEFTKKNFLRLFVSIRLYFFPDHLAQILQGYKNPYQAFHWVYDAFRFFDFSKNSLYPFDDSLRTDKVSSALEFGKLVNDGIEKLILIFGEHCSAYDIIVQEIGYCSQNLIIQFNLHQKYFAMQSISEDSFFPKRVREYCTQQCSQYRNNWKNNRKSIFHAFKSIIKNQKKQAAKNAASKTIRSGR